MMLHNDILKYVLFPMLGRHDLCACAQVCMQWHDAAVHTAKKQYSEYMLQHYACAGMYDAYIAINKPAPQAINLAITFGRDAFVSACIRDGYIPEITLSNHNSIEAELLRDYLDVSITMSRDNIFTMLYMRGGWYFPKLILTSVWRNNVHAFRKMYHCTHPLLSQAVFNACQGNKRNIIDYLKKYGDYTHVHSIMDNYYNTANGVCSLMIGEDVDVPDMNDNDTATLELFA
jgi:hypothetical protein